jgi:hypothetical protein
LVGGVAHAQCGGAAGGSHACGITLASLTRHARKARSTPQAVGALQIDCVLSGAAACENSCEQATYSRRDMVRSYTQESYQTVSLV